MYKICSYFVAYLLEVEWTLLLHLNGLVETMSQEQMKVLKIGQNTFLREINVVVINSKSECVFEDIS